MYKDPSNFNKMKRAFFESFSIKSTKCLEPNNNCSDPLIDSHSIQDSRILDILSIDNHVIQIEFDKDCVSKSTLDNIIEPSCKYSPISIHKASTFNGLCNKHDTEMFRPIDTEELDLENPEHVFLLTYRSVLKELSSLIRGAVMNQSTFLNKVDLGEADGNGFSLDALMPVLQFEKAYIFNDYKLKFDADYLSKDYTNIYWKYLVFDCAPTFATSSVFTPMEMASSNDETERICVNAFPYNNHMYLLFSCRKDEKLYFESYLQDIFNASGEYQKYLISKLILRNCENTFFSPKYFDTWDEKKKTDILDYYHKTCFSDLVEYENTNLYLF